MILTFASAIREQLRIGTTVALAWGILTGAITGALIVSMNNARLVLPTTVACVYAIVFLASLFALLSVLILLPVEVIFAAAVFKFRALHGVKPARFYSSFLIIGSVFIFYFLVLAFKWIRNPESPVSIGLYIALALLALGTFLVLNLPRQRSSVQKIRVARGSRLLVVFAFCAFLAHLSYHSLRKFPELTGQIHRGVSQKNLSMTSPPPAPITRRNVLLISIDTLRADHLGCYGYGKSTSPHLDKLASNSAVFLNAHSHSPWTLPSHATMLTSLYSSSHGARFSSQHTPILDKLDDSNLTMAETLGAAGYRSGAFTSCFWFSKPWGLLQGFSQSKMDPSNTAQRLVDNAVQWVKAESEHPFFLFLHFYDVHNYKSPSKFAGRYVDPNYHGKLKDQKLLTAINGYDHLSADDLADLVAKYDGALSYVDDELGRLFDWLRSTRLYNKTMIVITSDHGEEFWEHGGTGHGFTLYEEMLHVPLIIKLPEQNSTIRIPDFTGVIDIVPTVLDLLSIPRSNSLEGVSLVPLMRRGKVKDRAIFAEDTYFLNSYSMIRQGYKYTENRIPPTELLNPELLYVNLRCFFKFRKNELYHIDKDPYEKSNLLSVEGARAKQMREALLQNIRIHNPGEHGTIDEKTREELRSIGYVQ